MNRRAFLGLLGTAAAATVIDPERLCGNPGRRRFPAAGGSCHHDRWRRLADDLIPFHKDAFSLVSDQLEVAGANYSCGFSKEALAAAARDLADEIDRRALEAFYAQRPAIGHRMEFDILYGAHKFDPRYPAKLAVIRGVDA